MIVSEVIIIIARLYHRPLRCVYDVHLQTYIGQTIWFPQVSYTLSEPEYFELDDSFDNPAMDKLFIFHQTSEQTFEVLVQFSSSSASNLCDDRYPATVDQDYQLRDRSNGTSFILLVSPGSSNSTVPFTLLPDNATEATEFFLITLSHPENSESPIPNFISFTNEACVLIEDDESK